jgi:hypothetical protein
MATSFLSGHAEAGDTGMVGLNSCAINIGLSDIKFGCMCGRCGSRSEKQMTNKKYVNRIVYVVGHMC